MAVSGRIEGFESWNPHGIASAQYKAITDGRLEKVCREAT